MKKTILLIGCVLMLIGCKKENQIAVKSVDEKTQTIVEIKHIDSINIKSSDEYLRMMEQKYTSLNQKLKKANGIKANDLLKEYHIELSKILNNLNKVEDNFLNNFAQYQSMTTLPDSISQKINTFKQLGIEVQKKEDETSKYTLGFIPGNFYRIFKNKVTKDVEVFLKMRTEEKLNPLMKEDSLILPFEEVEKRTIAWENYIQKYPETKFIENAKKRYVEHIKLYLFGAKNQQSISYSTKKMTSDCEKRYLQLIKKQPNTTTAKLTKSFLDFYIANINNLKPNEFQKKITEHLNTEIKRSI